MSAFSCLIKLIFRYCTYRTINYFALCAIILSVSFLFTVNAVLKGFDHELQSLFRGSLADSLVEWRWPKPELKELESTLTPHAVWAPALDGFGMLKTDSYISAINFKGIDPKREQMLRKSMKIDSIDFSPISSSNLSYKSPLGSMVNMFGQVSESKPLAPMLVGKVLAEELNIQIGDKIKLVIPNWRDEIKAGDFKVTGIFKSGIYEDDQGKVFISIDEAQTLLSKPGDYSYIQCDVDSNNRKFNDALQSLYPMATITSWKEKHKNRLRAVYHERKIIAIVLSSLVLIASFGILAIQWNFVLEKTTDIGILRAIGFSGKDIFIIFLGVTCGIGVLGCGIGFLLGLVLCENANEILKVLDVSLFPTDLYYQEKLPVIITSADFIWIGTLSLSVTFIAGLFPAWKAVKVEPLVALTHD
jgi:lipoprotein-releasing system permease protein